MTTTLVTQPLRKSVGRPTTRPLTCDVCKLAVAAGAPVLFAQQEGGTGPYHGMSGWYVACTHALSCGADFLRSFADEYTQRACRGCHRVMWVRQHSRRSHCSGPCRQAYYRRRRVVSASALAVGRVLYRDELYWLTRPGGDPS